VPTIHQEGGFRFVIYLNDHSPPHVHVIGDGHAKVLVDDSGPLLDEADGFNRGQLRAILRIAAKEGPKFLRMWNKIHG
jgi:hypothetical protein